MENLTISEVARRTGLRASAIRYYESLALLPMTRRVSGQRRFGTEVIERLTFIQTARRLGFSLAEIQTLFQDQPTPVPLPERWQFLVQQRLGEVKTLIQEARHVQQRLEGSLGCTCSDLEDCIDCVLAVCQE